jgi:hypothetical protein
MGVDRKGSTQVGWERMDHPLLEGNWPVVSASPVPYLDGQLPSSSGWSIRSQPTCVEPLRPACPSCITIFVSRPYRHEDRDAAGARWSQGLDAGRLGADGPPAAGGLQHVEARPRRPPGRLHELVPHPVHPGPVEGVRHHALDRAGMDRVRDEFVEATGRAARAGFDMLELHCGPVEGVRHLAHAVEVRDGGGRDDRPVALQQRVVTGRAARAGFDMLELHCAHGYLMASFLSPLTNTRAEAIR